MEADSWLLTWTTYGTWLPGDERGFVGNVVENPPTGVGGSKAAAPNVVPTVQADYHGEPQGDAIRAADASGLKDEALTANAIRAADASRRVTHNLPGTPYDRAMPGLRYHALQRMRGEPVWLDLPHANLFLEEARRVAEFRSWQLHAVAVMANHAHLVVTAPKGVPGERLLQEFKSYGSRVLNRRFGKPESGTWWTKSGSTRVLSHEKAVHSAVEYVRNQHRPLALWISDRFEPTGANERELGNPNVEPTAQAVGLDSTSGSGEAFGVNPPTGVGGSNPVNPNVEPTARAVGFILPEGKRGLGYGG